LFALNLPTYHAFGRFDPFHEGESLGAALSAMDHQVPYRDYFFFHGVFQDPLRSALAFKWFGRSIGAARTLESLIKIGTWILLSLFLARVFRANRPFAYLALISTAVLSVPFLFDVGVEPFIVPHSPENIIGVFQRWESWFSGFHWIILSGRDLLTAAFLLSFLPILGQANEGPPVKRPLAFFLCVLCFTGIPLLALGHSVDRGIYLTAASLLFSVWFFFSCFNRPGSRGVFLGGVLSGWACGALLLGLALQWNYGGFMDFVFGVLPRYKMMTDGLPYPIREPRFAFVMILLAFYFFRLTLDLLRSSPRKNGSLAERLRIFLLERGTQTLLLLLAVFCFRNVLERPVEDHLAYSSIWLYLLVLLDLFHSFGDRLNERSLKMIGGLIGAVLIGLCLYRLAAFGQWERNFPLKRDDASFLSEDRKQVVAFMRKELREGEPFFALTNDPSWYYLLDRPSPTPYPCLWVAAPMDFQRKVVESLERKKIRLILYKNSGWESSIDDIPDTQRFPAVTRYIREHYVPYKKIADQEIWKRKS
jgi:hypothetical protein